MRTADKNRINRAIEHLNAARTNLDSIKEENRTEEVDALYCFDLTEGRVTE